jgi:asparagine synthase (glutamine-hydrolysing)
MCGITGLFRRGGPDPGDAERLVAMTESLVHRGPDDHGRLLLDSRSGRYHLDAGVGDASAADVLLGNRRLAIIDCSPAGRQPMANARRPLPSRSTARSHNYVELREEPRRPRPAVRLWPDTEVVLQAYEEWGPDCVRRFNGMWSFALWDQPPRRLFCSVTGLGAKPFYYRVDAGLFAFGSEIKAILRVGLDRPAPHWPTILDFLVRGMGCHTVETFFDGIHRLPAAHNLVVTRDRVQLSRYWNYTDQSHGYDFGRPEATFAELFDDAVRLRLRSDMPVGVALSGGIDSASVTVVARRHLPGAPLRVFTVAFPGKPYDELRYAELVARQLDAELHTVVYRPERLIDDLRTVIWHMDYPTPHSQILPRWRLMGLAARHVRVILEGQGSDEMLAGYPLRYFPHYVALELGRHTRGDLVRRYGRLLAEAARMTYGLGRNAVPAIAAHVVPPLNRLRPAVHLQHSVISPDFASSFPGTRGRSPPELGPG